MKIVVIYDSTYGNTEKIAKAIAETLSPSGNVDVMRAAGANPEMIKGSNLIIIGAPTNGGRPTPAVQELLARMNVSLIQGVKVAAFDTRLTSKLVGIFGYAAGKIGDSLKKSGGNLVAPPEGFFVKGTKGPLKEGELERAASWAKSIVKI